VTIIRTQHSSNFTITPNTVINESTLSLEAFGVWAYLISKPKTWNFNAGAIKRKFGIGLNKVYRIMRELIQAGYAFYKRTQSACEWFIYDTPQNIKTTTAPAVIDRVNFEHVKNERVLESIEPIEIIKQLPEAMPEPAQKSIVVVDSELFFPEQLNPDQKKAAKHIIKKVKQPELQQPVLFALAYAMVNQKINSVPAYLQGLVTRANNGTFEPVGSVTAKPEGGKPLIPLWRGFKASTPSEPEKARGFIQQAKQALRGMANKPIEGVI
jgi:hypothetical protein